ncbi:MAG: DUF262 domain-containing protein [Salinispira sp.]
MSDTETRRGFEKIQLNNNNLVFADIMSNGKKYIVPRFQRDYSWNVEQWDELWRDIEDMRKNRSQHFMGYLVFQENMEAAFRVFQVIDGQQRLTTLSLIIVAVLSRLRELVNNTVDAEDNISRIDMYQKSYLGVTDPSTPRIKDPKLRLNRHNDQTFRILAERLEALSERNMMATNVLIHETFEFFRKKLKHYQSGAELTAMVNDISQGLLFTTITVPDDLSAYAMFETLNARGVSLSTPDLLKNYLLSTMVSADSYLEDELEDIEEHWAYILEQLGETEFNNFLRSYRGLRDKLVPKKELFRTLKKDISSPQDVQPYLYDLQKYAQATARLGNMALVKNSDRMGQESFQEKRKVLEASGYKINAHIAKYPEWDMDALAKHQQWLARKAQMVWKISQLEKEAL